MRGLIRFLVYLIITTCSVACLQAQQGQQLRDRDPDLEGSRKVAAELQQANFHHGPFYLMSRIRIANAAYTEDVFLPTGDQRNGLSLGIEAPQRLYFVPRRKVVLSASFIPGYSFFDRDGLQRQFNWLARGDAQFLLNHVYLDVYGSTSNQLQSHVAEINRLATAKEQETGVGGEFKYSSRTSALFALRLHDIAYPRSRLQPEETIPIQILDRSERNARVSLLHKTFPLTSLFVAAEGSDYTFDRASYKDSQRTFFSGGFILDGGRSHLRLEAGPQKLTFDDPAQKDYSGIGARLSADRTSGRWNYQIGGARDVGFAIMRENNYYVTTTAQAGIAYNTTRKLTLRLNSAAERDEFDVPIEGHIRRDTTTYNSVGFLYTFHRLSAGADVGWYDRTSTYGGDEDSGIRSVIHLSFTL